MTTNLIALARSLLFVPGNRPERFAKATGAGADVVVIDLEDAVGPNEKNAARAHAADWLAAGNTAMVRINGYGTSWYEEDLAMVTTLGASMMVPKAENPDILATLTDDRDIEIVALVETAVGVLNARALADVPGVSRLAFGSIDFAAELGIDPTDREALLAARSSLVVASAAAELAGPIDGVTTALNDESVLRQDVEHGRRLGLTAKLCIHPSQVGVVHNSLAPNTADVDWARRILAGTASDEAATSVDGHMVDAPVLARARRILADAQRK
ncbi:HpcH/HpaI aldolase/citrate lyase family protein [Mycobacterium sp. 48b]|uniref:HpcH/HpaI aldolase/citrate lyase family protein n=1 Tax=Mycobacterium sp. 48b TaxID=3400426 RepID=UPI003AAB793E